MAYDIYFKYFGTPWKWQIKKKNSHGQPHEREFYN